MIVPSPPPSVPLFHSLGDGTVEQTCNQRNNPWNRSGTFFLKALANKVLERNTKGNKHGTAASISVPPLPQSSIVRGTKNKEKIFSAEKETSTDNTDGFKLDVNVSVLSVPSGDLFDKESLFYDYEERLAIAEYDGHQTPFQAERVAYLDAFVSVLVTLPQESFPKPDSEGWLDSRIREAKNWLATQELEQPE